jgi:hypothetical protein
MLTALQLTAKPFFDQGAEKVFIVKCCGRVYVGLEPASKCRTCSKIPKNHEAKNLEELAQVAKEL